ncbi:2,4-dienoyl-CoA reductase-like NADH-dependent reductase (Old Yellow Enzyme family) [Jatrophihabitans sp. GAS493]|uniref:alkene reductase n=1 Tax=Jatrophihabitans sp. GAS493 TaxID=1907575 RepID=UPI000BB96021|nr:alkene reductase [Jatrophihabitans sp. GAS493]SOD74757.1 2,4-dienoyl-CoA reductase-like NADH-dependent reductase (Old Yellow Enzyme family) [Jatrophihabitans sp. GAS493]
MPDLFEPVNVGKLNLANRVVMAPLTRNRAGSGQVPRDIAATYYGQRAGAGLIITEGTQPSAVGQGYLNTPGIHTPAQIEGWRNVADAVHAAGGQIVVQLMHAGRIAHPENKNGLESVAPSAIPLEGEIVTATGPQPHVVPRALETEEIADVVAEFVHAARSAIEAGLDGVEIHAANGYLVHQFLAPSANQRSDAFGGSPQARAQFAIAVTTAVAEAIGPERVGIRISPSHNVQGAIETDPVETAETYTTLVEAIAPLGLAYLHILADPSSELVRSLRAKFDGAVIVNDGFGSVTDLATAQRFIDEDLGDLVAVGRNFISNPDLVQRWKQGAPLNKPDQSTFYGGDAAGYTDYPFLESSPTA